jgi:hypothetical protein
MAVLAAIRDGGSDGVCSLAVEEPAERAGVSIGIASRAVSVAILLGVIERGGNVIRNRCIGQ